MILKWVNDMKNYNFVKREISLNLTDLINGAFAGGSDKFLCANHWFDRRYYD